MIVSSRRSKLAQALLEEQLLKRLKAAVGGDGEVESTQFTARIAGADAQGDHVVLDGFHILFLAQSLGLDGLALGGDADHIPRQLDNLALLALPDQLDDIAHILLVDGFPLLKRLKAAVGGDGEVESTQFTARIAGGSQWP